MPAQIGIGFSHQRESKEAAREAASQSKTNLKTEHVDWSLVLMTGHYDAVVMMPIIKEVLKQDKITGSSTAGIILSNSIETRGVAVLTIASDDMKFGIGAMPNIDTANIDVTGIELTRHCLEDLGEHSRQVFLFFVDSNLQNVSPLIQSLQASLGNIFPIIGAGSCNRIHPRHTFQIYQRHTLTNAATGVIMGGHISVGVGSQHGWRPLGKPRTITEAEGNIIRTIDKKPAYSIYEEYCREETQRLQSQQLEQMATLYPLGILIEESKNYLLRNAIDILTDGSIVCQGNIPPGTQIHVMIGNKDFCKYAAQGAAKEANQNLLGKTPSLVIILESMARLKLFGRTALQEILEVRKVFGATVPIIGMYADGEIAPLQSAERFKRPHLQNKSIVVLAIG